jgi:phosphatidylglycerophosphatase A
MEHPQGHASPRWVGGQEVTSPRMHRLVASLFGTGLILRRVRGSDAGSGTIGGLVALPFALLIGETWGWWGQLVAAALVTAVALWASAAVVSTEGDAGWIVIDEAAGTFISTIGLLGWPAVVAFVVFRIADITKRPFPGVHQADSMPGATGIVLDDVVAGLWALSIGHLLNATVF